MKIFNYRTFSFPVGSISAIFGATLIIAYYKSVILILVGLTLLGFGVYLLDIAINHYKALIKFGNKIPTKIIGVLMEISNPSLRMQPAVGNLKIFNLLINGFDPVLGKEREFRSSNLFNEPSVDFAKSIDVYVNQADNNDYYVDVRTISFKEGTSLAFSEVGKYKSSDGKNYLKLNQ